MVQLLHLKVAKTLLCMNKIVHNSDLDLVLKNGSIKVEGYAHIYTKQEPGTVENFSTLFVENDDKVEIKDLENYDIEIKNADCFFK